MAWDGEKMAHNFTNTQINLFSRKICTKLLHHDLNIQRLDSYKEPILKQDYFQKYPDEVPNQIEDDDPNSLVTLTKGSGAKNETPACRNVRPKTKKGDEPPSSNATSKGETGTPKRKRGRPSKKQPAPETVTEDVKQKFSTDAIEREAKRATRQGTKRTIKPGQHLSSPYKTEY